MGDKACIALLSCSLGSIARLRADHARAAALYEEGLLLYKELGSKLGIAQALEGMATVRGACGQPGPATRLWSAAEALREEIGASPPDPERARREPVIATARKALGEEAFANAWSEGRRLTPEQVLDGWWEQAAVDPGLARLAGLTAGEIKVLRLVASGKSNAQVAEKLFISRRTVDAHLRSIYRKLGVDSRTAAARHATERGLV